MLDATKRRGERYRNHEDFDSMFKRSQNHNLELIDTIWRSQTEVVEHEIGEPRGFTSQVQEEQERTKVE